MPRPANENAPHRSARRPLSYFAFVIALSVPFWLVGAATGIVLLPGVPVSALMAFCPAIAAAILTYRDDGLEGVKALLSRSFDFARIRFKVWYLPVIFLMPCVMALSYALLRITGAQFSGLQLFPVTATAMFAAFFVNALGEELGWSGYATDPLQERWSALGAALVIGLFWAAWHIVPLLQVDRSAAWIAWWGLGTVALRVLMVWLYNNTGRSVFATALFHTMTNMSMLLYSAIYLPAVTSPILAATAVAVVLLWGPRTLTRRREV